MKQKLLNLLAIFVVFLSAIPIANAAEITFTFNKTPKWHHKGHLNAGKTMAISNGTMYLIAPSNYNTVTYVNESTSFDDEKSYDFGLTTGKYGFAMDNDDAGNIVIATNETDYYNPYTHFWVYPTGATNDNNKKVIKIPDNLLYQGRCDFMRVQGNVLSGKGYIWIIPSGTQNILRFNVVNGEIDSNTGCTVWTYSTPAHAQSQSIAYMLDDGRIYFHSRGNGLYLYTAPENGGALTSYSTIPYSDKYVLGNLTSEIFTLQGNQFHVINSGGAYGDISFDVKNLSTGEVLASNINVEDGVSTTGATDQLSNIAGVGTVVRAIKVDACNYDIYCYAPSHGAAVYRVTANVKVNTVSNVNTTYIDASTKSEVKLTWNAPATDVPTKYEIKYSSDGGTTWSSAIETTALSYIFRDLPTGTYTFKVTPYYEQYLTYGAEVKTSSIEIIEPCPTVSDVVAETFEDRPYVATISWEAPKAAKASKYAVNYSTDGGSSWTSTFETTALSYTFTNLPVGTYTFKVAPYFSETSEWGDEVVSNNIEITDPIFYTFTTSKRWEVGGTLGTADAPGGKSIAVSNNKMYVGAPDKYGTMYYVGQSSSSASWDKFDTGYTSWDWGYAMDNDDTGNIIITSDNGISKPTTQFTVYPAGATANTNKKVITLTGNYLPEARFDFMAAQGNVYSGTGYIWFAPNGTKSIKRIKIENVSGTPTPTAVTTWTLPMATSNQVAIRPLDDGRLYFHNRTGSCAIITLPEGGGEVASSMIENLSISATAKGNMNSDVFMLRENTFHVKNDGAASSSIGIEIKNLTTAGNGDASYVPFNGLTPANGNSTVSGVGDYGSMVRAVKVDENTADIYCYSPNHGVTVYRVSADKFDAVTTPVENLKGEFKFNDVGEIWGRQDVILTWDEPVGYSGATITGYNIYRDNKLQKTVDASTRTFTDINIVASPTYIVAPLYNGVEMNPKSVTVDYTFIPIPPVDFKARTYNGYGSVQLFWKRTTDVGIKPSYYNIYRDELPIGTSQSFNFYEDKLSAGVHKYVVEAVYDEMAEEYIGAEGRTAKSDPVTIIVEARDTEKTTYTLEEIYNYTLDEINNQPANFNDRDYYRQGAYYNGKWYIAQRSDYLTKNDSPEEDGVSDWESGVATATGGIVKFSAEDPRTGVESKPITLPEGSNVGIATDKAGNIFVRQNSIDRIENTTPDGAAAFSSSLKDYFARRFTSGYIYLATEGYSEASRIDVDLSGLYTNRNLRNILPDWNELAQDAYVDNAYKSQRGRSDYYSLEGDVTSDDGGYLYFSPSKSPYVIKVNIKVANGVATVDAANAVIVNLAGEHETIDGTMAKVTYGIENYAFPVNNRNNFISQIRSNGYFGIHKENGENHIHPIFTTESRINNSGGTTIEFNNDLFIISPQTMYSASSGDFMVSKGIKSDVANVATADLSNPLPVAQWTQTKQAANVQTNASGNWLFAELGKFELSSDNLVECVYIYQYVPGERIAKYVLFPNNVFPAPPVAINLDPTYKSSTGEVIADQNSSTGANKDAVDLLSFDGYAYWAKPNYDNDKADKYKYNSYTVKLYQEGDLNPTKTIYKLDSPELNALGSETTTNTIKIGKKEFKYNYRIPINNADNKRIWRIEVNTTYVNIEEGKENDTYDSEVSFDHTYDLYTGIPAKGTVKVYTNPAFPAWYDKDWNLVYKYMHRVDIDFNKPVFESQRVEPVTHYEIWVDKAKDGIYEEQLKEFNLMTGLYNPTTRADVGTVASQIKITDGKIVSETYNPNTSKGYALGEEELAANRTEDYQCVLTFYQLGSINDNAGGAMGDGDKTELNPANWNYQLRSVYAAGNSRISTTEIFNMEAGQTPIYTGAEGVKDNASTLKLYPVPTDFMLNIECDEAIYLVDVYNEDGKLMISLPGSYLPTMQLDLSNLATGYYFVRVNNNAPVKILKK